MASKKKKSEDAVIVKKLKEPEAIRGEDAKETLRSLRIMMEMGENPDYVMEKALVFRDRAKHAIIRAPKSEEKKLKHFFKEFHEIGVYSAKCSAKERVKRLPKKANTTYELKNLKENVDIIRKELKETMDRLGGDSVVLKEFLEVIDEVIILPAQDNCSRLVEYLNDCAGTISPEVCIRESLQIQRAIENMRRILGEDGKALEQYIEKVIRIRKDVAANWARNTIKKVVEIERSGEKKPRKKATAMRKGRKEAKAELNKIKKLLGKESNILDKYYEKLESISS